MAKVKKKELGKGIRALLGNIENNTATPKKKKAAVKELSSAVAMVSLEEISVNPFNPRTDFAEEALEELAASIKVHGLIQPITLRRLSAKEYQIISGERRFRASKLAGLKEVPAYVRLADDQQMIEMALIENIQREDLNAIEVAITYQRLIDECDLTHEVMAERVGKKRSSISNHLRLLDLPPEIQQSLKDKNITMGHARVLAGVKDPAQKLILFKKEQLSVRELEKISKLYGLGSSNKKGAADLDSDYKNVQTQFQEYFGTKKVKLKVGAKGKGQILIPFKDTKELNRLLDILDND